MQRLSEFRILPQPTDTTCGPTCLQAVYRYYHDEVALGDVIAGVRSLNDGGTLAALLACHALRRGYHATIYTYNLQLFDPTWFERPMVDLRAKLAVQQEAKHDAKLKVATAAYLEFLELGGVVRYEDLRGDLLRRYLKRDVPILTGLSATHLHRAMREHGPNCDEDDVRGHPTGHFVVLCGYDRRERRVRIADPLTPNPLSASRMYTTTIDRLVNAILLGVLTYDANLLMIEPPDGHEDPARATADRR